MASSAPPALIKFVDEAPSSDQNVRDHELDISERKAHAARVAHERKTRQPPGSTSPSSEGSAGDAAPSTRKGMVVAKPRRGGNILVFDESSTIKSTSKKGSPSTAKKTSTQPSTKKATTAPAKKVSAVPPLPSPLKGNSDPFGALAISVTPQVSQVLQFMHDGVYPGLYFNSFFRRMYGDVRVTSWESSSWLPAQTAQAGWHYALSSLNDEGLALACIGGYLNNMAMLMPESSKRKATRLGLTMMTKSSMLLRRKLQDQMDQDLVMGTALINHIYWLFRAAIFSRDEASITTHGQMLNLSLMKGLVDGSADILMLIQAGVDDVDVCARLMRRTFIHPAAFAKVCAGLWAMAEPLLPHIRPEVYSDLHPNVEITELREIYNIGRHLAEYSENKVSEEEWGPPDMRRLSFAWFVTKSDWSMRMCLSLIPDLRDDRYEPRPETSGVRLTQAGLALATLYYIRRVGHHAVVNGVDFRDASGPIIEHMKVVMDQVYASCTEEELERYAEGHLYILFVGAFYERRGTKADRHLAGRWFQRHLAAHAVKYGWQRWTNVRPILRRFHYVEWVQPNGSLWYEDIVKELSAG
ncbi:uncharacterized protein Z518_09964 [Rhinocladiella mackenziei CBS 650.93]|uniref:Uncharacterized protein n=1 Tax=Rhinocladiella mackenziei CBS 650.93 TaxID=1442369 RepID=A0A0D2I514_9EURO|nr:uncharacterized protein Z518_09964 [Rhinocladiella mackenziei CBS 650.93]KIX00899.1 hypothetical protein Z518_09964 [Rhinocladiella mackenziei CBS 650.93]